MTGTEGLTAKTVSRVYEARKRQPKLYDKIFDDIDALVLQAVSAVQDNDIETLGELMNVCQGFLNAIEVSTPELEKMIDIARKNGAIGAKLTGAGGGGSIVALCPGKEKNVAQALQDAGYQIIRLTVNP